MTSPQGSFPDGILPNDPLFRRQWHLLNRGREDGGPNYDLNVVPVWADHTGRGVRVGVVDSGVDYRHPDLAANYDGASDLDVLDRDADAAPWTLSPAAPHGTGVAGLIAAQAGNGIGGTGVAPGATLVGFRAVDAGWSLESDAAAMREQVHVDISNNSWGYTVPFADDFQSDDFRAIAAAVNAVAAHGRNGLGTVLVFAAGNGRDIGDNVNCHNMPSSRLAIAVAAANADGTVSSYSTPGASILVAGFGSETAGSIVTTDIAGPAGNTPGDYTDRFNGTSAAAPMVSGVIALMLEANPELGYRDVQEILAYSARRPVTVTAGWQVNGAHDSNGGGLHVSHDLGFGLVDAHAAVRLAETWMEDQGREQDQPRTWHNERHAAFRSTPEQAIPDLASVSDTIAVENAPDLVIDHVEIDLDIDHGWIGDLTVTLTSPDGTRSVLLDRPGVTAGTPGGLGGNGGLHFTTTSVQHWGEHAAGVWTLTVTDALDRDTGVLRGWSLRIFGDPATPDDRHVYTDEYAVLSRTEPDRTVLSDTAGIDTLNAAAVSTDQVIDLRPDSVSRIAGAPLRIGADTVIEHAFGGDGNDILIGNEADNRLCGGRGADTLTGGGGADQFRMDTGCGAERITDFGAGDRLDLRAFGFDSADAVLGIMTDDPDGTLIPLSAADSVLLYGIDPGQIQAADLLL